MDEIHVHKTKKSICAHFAESPCIILIIFKSTFRLFLDQLINISIPIEKKLGTSDDSSLLVSLLNGNSAKLCKLESRVTKASPSQKSNSCDSMYREFQFFRGII